MFKDFKRLMQAHFSMLLMQSQVLFRTNINTQLLWDAYLDGFPEEVRQEYNCNCCKSFIKHYGGLVFIVNGVKYTLWDFECMAPFDQVVKNLKMIVSDAPVIDRFLSKEDRLGTDRNNQLKEDGQIVTWEHMCLNLPASMVNRTRESIPTLMGTARDTRNVFKRSLEEISEKAIDTALELIAQNTLYRGAEFKGMLEQFRQVKVLYDSISTEVRDNFCWENAHKYSDAVARIRNTAIGTLLVNISENMDLDKAVTAFEKIMAPANYKRPNAIITQSMIQKAEETLQELGYAKSLGRRFATVDDITVNNVLFVNRDTTKFGGILEDLKASVPVNPKSLSRVDEVPVDMFLSNVLPKCTSVEVLFENRHIGNLVSLITAVDPKAPSLFKWNNPFSWSYKNSLTDSIKEKVKAAGGKVDGFMRFSLEWYNYDDLDLHVIEPDGQHIYYGDKHSMSGGNLDVDMNAGSGRTRQPVENIIWPQEPPEGKYKVYVFQFNRRETIDTGFSVEMEIQGQSSVFAYKGPVSQGSSVTVVEFTYSRRNGITMISSLPHDDKVVTKTEWGIDTNKFHKAAMIMRSPNYWDGKAIGNSHLFFVLDQAHNTEMARGFFNEFLKDELTAHKRVFEALGSRMQVQPADRQVTGLGFSSTQHTDLICKIESPNFNRYIKLKF